MSMTYYHAYDECPCCGRSEKEEIGLASAGWKFLFQQGGWGYWRKRLEFGIIEDEAGRAVSLEALSRVVREHQPFTSNRNCRGMTGLRVDNEGYEYMRGAR